MKKQLMTALGVLTAVTLVAPPAVLACSFNSQPYFTWTKHPDLPTNKFAKGDLGLLDGGYARSYLLVAYRYLAGKPLSEAEQKGAVELWNNRLTIADATCPSDASGWLKARETVPGTKKIENFSTEKPINSDEAWQMFCNCQTPAFTQATATLQSMITKYGANAPEVKQWLAAQDQVFSNCGPPAWGEKPTAMVPPALPAHSDATFEQQRAYQIASAQFYAGGSNYRLAAEGFDKIAADSSSPYHHIAPYLAVRALIREVSLGKDESPAAYAPASQRLAKLAADPNYADLKNDIALLEDFIEAHSDPLKHLHVKLAQPITESNLAETTKMIDRLLESKPGSDDEVDYAHLPPALRAIDEIDWVLTYQTEEKPAVAHAVERWQKTHSLPWLVAAISAVKSDDPHVNELIAAATKEEAGPAKWTLFYNINRLRQEQEKDDEVRTALDRVLDSPPSDIPPGTLNAMRAMRLDEARNLDEIVKFGVQRPLSVCTNGGTEQVPDDMDQIVSKGHGDATSLMFTPEAGNIIQHRLPLSLLKQLAQQPGLPANVKNDLVWTSWVRAVLIDDETAAKALAPLVKAGNPKKATYIDTYLAATTRDDRKFAAVNLMLHFSSAQPSPNWGPLNEDGYGDAAGWWWSANPKPSPISLGWEGDDTVDDVDPDFLTAAQKAQANAEVAKLAKVAAAPNYFAQIVLPYAKSHPADPRVPEALAWLVKATHYGMTDDASKTYSKQAFNILHTQYKTNAWTKKTPYYY